ncbi:MAG TPA: alpha/beta hydrolase [Anaerolineales bacterium]|nr:alpha/beta hydrolase [Anaerolineae bacterium]HIQ01617.1 alpha/beta hydrolase [Anaerolineales bacterium]
MSAIIIENGLVHYEAIGRGAPLIFLHGWLGSWRYWVPAMDDLSDRYRTYALDLWGFGDSDRQRGGYSLSAYVTLLQQFMEEMAIGRAPLVGHALGGVVALRMAAEMPERVEQVMAVSTPLVGSALARPLASFSDNNGEVATRILGRRQIAAYPEVQMEAGKTDAAAVVSSVRAVLGEDLRRDLDELRMPVLLVYGKNDSLIYPPEGKWLKWVEENVRIILLEGARHFPMLEEMNKFNRLLRQFLEFKDDLDALELKEEWRRRMR